LDRLFDSLVSGGMKVLPKDDIALKVLFFSIGNGAAASLFLGKPFSELPEDIRPIALDNPLTGVYWNTGKIISNKIKDIITWDGNSNKGFWSDSKGKKIKVTINLNY
jgi:hypothetical protein